MSRPAPAPVPCLGQSAGTCGATIRRETGPAICGPCSARVYAVVRALPGADDLSERQRISNYVWSDRQSVRAALTGDIPELLRRIDHRRLHGFYADPDRAPVLAGI